MQSKLAPLVACCLLCAICVGQWSSPVPLLSGSPPIAGQSLVAGAGDTMWAAVVTGQTGSSGPYQVLACWTTGGAWSQPAEVTPPDSGWMFSEPGMGRDASGRLWIAWYRGDYPTKESESSAVWAAYRDSAGWHAPEKVCSGVAAAGPMSFAADAAGNWHIGFATLTPYKDFAYSSAVYCRLVGDSWQSPRYIAHGMGSPIETDYSAPKLVPRPDSGLWAACELSVGGSNTVSMVKIVQRDTSRRCLTANGSDPAATADSAGRLWILYSELAMHWVSSQVIVDSTPVDTALLTNDAEGPARVVAVDDRLVWAAWPQHSSHLVMVNYAFDMAWTPGERASDSAGVPKGIAIANGVLYVMFQTPAGRLYSVHRLAYPGVQEQPTHVPVGSHPPTVARSILFLRSSLLAPPSSLISVDGRKVMDLKPGANDVSRLSPGVYFIREEGPGVHGFECPSRIVVVAR